MVPFTHPDTQMIALTKTRAWDEQLNSVHAATVLAENGPRRGRFSRIRH